MLQPLANAQLSQTSVDFDKGPVKFRRPMQPLIDISRHLEAMNATELVQSSRTINEIRIRQRMGEPLTNDEEEELRLYFSKYGRQKVGLHLSGDRKESWRAKAELQGLSLSAWIQEKVVEALAGPSQAEKLLRDENGSLRDEIAGLRGTSGHLAVENSKLQARLEALEANLMEAMERALQARFPLWSRKILRSLCQRRHLGIQWLPSLRQARGKLD
jgi:hypothetical protein